MTARERMEDHEDALLPSKNRASRQLVRTSKSVQEKSFAELPKRTAQKAKEIKQVSKT